MSDPAGGTVLPIPGLAVALEDIPPEGLYLALDVTPADAADLAGSEGRERPVVLSPLTGAWRLRPAGGGRLSVTGWFSVTVERPCDRCLAEVPSPLRAEVDEVLTLGEPGDPETEESDGFLPAPDGRVDLSGLLAELFWLAWPYRFICRPDCAGLCPRCGRDLNEGPCACGPARAEGPGPFSA
jgi:uncharacterized protein